MLEVMIVLAALGEGPGFFERREVDFWNTRRRKAEPAADLWADSTAPPPVRRLLERPTAENARDYLAWQEARMSRLRSAMAAMRRPSGEKASTVACPFGTATHTASFPVATSHR